MKQLFVKLLIILTLCNFPNRTFSIDTPSLTETRTCLQHASARDAQLLLNLAYCSFQRSRANVTGADCLIKQVEHSWMLWQNYTQTRLNPERTLPYPPVTSLDTLTCNHAYKDHLQSNIVYAIMLEHVIKSGTLSQDMQTFVMLIRSQARLVVAHALWESIQKIEGSLGKLQATLAQSAQALCDDESACATMKKNIFTHGISYIVDGIGLQSFVAFDRKYNENSDKLMQAVVKSQLIFNEIWQKIEVTRAEFYRQLYMMIYTCMTELNFPQTSFMKAYDQQGPVASEAQKDLLPATVTL